MRSKSFPVALIFFGGLLVVGLFCFDDYGISWDGPVQREYGARVYNYLTKQIPTFSPIATVIMVPSSRLGFSGWSGFFRSRIVEQSF